MLKLYWYFTHHQWGPQAGRYRKHIGKFTYDPEVHKMEQIFKNGCYSNVPVNNLYIPECDQQGLGITEEGAGVVTA